MREIGMIKDKSLWILLGIFITTGLLIIEFSVPMAYLTFAWIIPATLLVIANLCFENNENE
jgi:hypothetical protein